MRALLRRVRAEVGARSTTGLVTPSSVHEGHGTAMHRADGSHEESEFQTAGGEFEIPIEALKEENLQQLFARMEPLMLRRRFAILYDH
jgi:hypothetical protein